MSKIIFNIDQNSYYYKKPSSYDMASPTFSSPNTFSPSTSYSPNLYSQNSYYTDYNQFSSSYNQYEQNSDINKKRKNYFGDNEEEIEYEEEEE